MSRLSNQFWRFVARSWPIRKGRTRVYRMAWNQLSGEGVFRDDFGNCMLLDLDSFIDTHIALDGAFEKESIELLLRLARERGCRVFVDIGANVGEFTLTLASRPEIEKAYAFEPDPENFERLSTNLKLNGADSKVEALRVALSSQTGEADFHLTRAPKEGEWEKTNRGTHSLALNPERHTDSFKVATKRLDDILALKGAAIAIKMDVEGHEVGVIAGMKRTLSENDCLLHAEIFPENLARAEALLAECGYGRMAGLSLDGSNFVYVRKL